MKKIIIQSSVAGEIMQSLKTGPAQTLKVLRKALRGGKVKRTGQMRRQRGSGIKAPFIPHLFSPAMQKAIRPILIKAVTDGDLDPIESGAIETRINRGIGLDLKHLIFIAGKLKAGKTGREASHERF